MLAPGATAPTISISSITAVSALCGVVGRFLARFRAAVLTVGAFTPRSGNIDRCRPCDSRRQTRSGRSPAPCRPHPAENHTALPPRWEKAWCWRLARQTGRWCCDSEVRPHHRPVVQPKDALDHGRIFFRNGDRADASAVASIRMLVFVQLNVEGLLHCRCGSGQGDGAAQNLVAAFQKYSLFSAANCFILSTCAGWRHIVRQARCGS